MSSEKNELLFSEFGVNYNTLPELYRKGTVLIWAPAEKPDKCSSSSSYGASADSAKFQLHPPSTANDDRTTSEAAEMAAASSLAPTVSERDGKKNKRKAKRTVVPLHVDIIGSKFWSERVDILHGE